MRTATQRDAAGDGRERRWATRGGRATRRYRVRLGRAHLRTWRRGATMRTASSGAGIPERDARETRYVAWCAARAQAVRNGHRRARQPLRRHGRRARKTLGDGGRSANDALPAATRENKRFATWVRGTSIFGHGGAAEQCKSHRREPEDRRETRAERYVAWCVARAQAARKGQRRARQRPTTPRATSERDVGRLRAAGQQGAGGGDSRTWFATWARGAAILGPSGAAQQRGPRRREPEDRSEMRVKRALRHGARRDHKRHTPGQVAHGNTPRRRGRGAQTKNKKDGRRQAAGQ